MAKKAKKKKTQESTKKYLSFNFKEKSEDKDGNLIIKGFANRAAEDGKRIIDRGNEHIPKEAWKIDEWMENPQIFFNHDRDIPIGKGVGAEVTDDGLFIEAMISKSNSPDIMKARDLIEEGILKSFSVGIDVMDEEEDKEGVLILKSVNLLEVSVVSIPMNQRSFFDISKKMLEDEDRDVLGEKILKAKGSLLSAGIHNRIHDLMQEGKGRDEIVTAMAEAGISDEILSALLSGGEVEITEELAAAIGASLGVEAAKVMELVNLERGEDEQEGEEKPEGETSEEDTQSDEKPSDDSGEASGDDEDSEDDDEGKGIGEEEKPSDADSEDDEDDSEDDEEEKNLEEDEDEDKGEGDLQEGDFQKCVSAAIQEGIGAGKDQDQAVAFAMNKCRAKHGESCELTLEGWEAAFKLADNLTAEKEGVTLEEKQGMGTVVPEDANLGENEFLKAQVQTNTLLAQLIGEIQGLKASFKEAIASQPVPPQTVPAPTEASQGLQSGVTLSKSIDKQALYKEKLKKKLSDLGV